MPPPGRRCSTWRARSRCAAAMTSSTVAPAPSSAATASWIRFSTSGSMPATKYSFGRPRRFPRRRDAASSSLAGSRSSSSGTGIGRARGIALVAAGDCVEQRRGVARVAGERPDLVERARERDDPVARHAAVRRLEPDDPGQRGRLADRAAGVRPERERRVERRDRDRRAAAASRPAPCRGPTGSRRGRRRCARSRSPSRTRPCSSCPGTRRPRRAAAR